MKAYTPFLNEQLQLVQPFINENESFFCYVQHGTVVSSKNHHQAHVGSLLQMIESHDLSGVLQELCQFTDEVNHLEEIVCLNVSQAGETVSFRVRGISAPLSLRYEEGHPILLAWLTEKEVTVTPLFPPHFFEAVKKQNDLAFCF